MMPNGKAAGSVAVTRRKRSLTAFGLVTALVMGASLTAHSQTSKKAPAAAASGSAAKASPKPPPAAKGAGQPLPSDGSLAPLPKTPAVEYLFKTTPVPKVAAIKKVKRASPTGKTANGALLRRLQKEVAEYEKDTKNYHRTITNIVKYHYKARKKRILSGLNREIKVEEKGLREARATAIKRLEAFIKEYSGSNADPQQTPDAMFRLAALYEEVARDEAPLLELPTRIKPAIALYKRVIREFPNYRERAAIFFYLGHALNDSGRVDEAQQVWRALVCNNRYKYPVPAEKGDETRDSILDKPQDHTGKYWGAWGMLHLDPIDQVKKKPTFGRPRRMRNAGKASRDEPLDSDEETSYTEIYPDSCKPVPQKTAKGAEPRYLAEIWWRIGDHHFDQLDPKGGPYNYNRSVSAYRHAMGVAHDKIKNIVYGVAMYKLAWSYFKQQRFEKAVKQFVTLLRYTDEREKMTGDPGADFRKEAYDYIAGSLTYVDFAGPRENDPYIVRADVLDTETNPALAEEKMAIGIERLQDDKLIPQDRPWTIQIYRSLAREYKELNQLNSATKVLEATLQKWPLHRDAPKTQDQLARIYDERARLSSSQADRKRFAGKALDARTGLSKYIGKTKWVDANKDDPEAIQTAERLVKGGLERAAAEHTNKARAYYNDARSTTLKDERRAALRRALDEYVLAEKGWAGFLKQDPNATNAYESRFWLADAKYWQVRLGAAIGEPATPEKVTDARAAAVSVRDSKEDDRFLEPAAQYVVAIAASAVKVQYRKFKTSGGSEGYEQKSELGLSGEGKAMKVEWKALPKEVVGLVAAWDEYYARVPKAKDSQKNRDNFRYKAAETFYLYGQFAEADRRLFEIYEAECGKTKLGFEAWRKLQSMANILGEVTGDYRRSRQLAQREEKDDTRCAVDDAQKAIAGKITKVTIQSGFYKDAAAAFTKAREMKKDGPERDKQWKLAGALYETALKAAPDRKEAPEAAINGAFSYKQVGDYDKAISMYRLFIDKYGADDILGKLEKGSPKEQAEYKERVKYLNTAYSALSKSYVLFFNYRAAAETYDTIASIKRFDAEKRKVAARNALVLYSNLGDEPKMLAARKTFLSFKPNEADKADADYIVAASDYKRWDENGADSGENRAARQKATSSLSNFFNRNRRSRAAAKYTVLAAYGVAKMKWTTKERGADEWRKRTIEVFKLYKSAAPTVDGKNEALGSRQGDMAAECDFALIDKEIAKRFDYDTGHHRFKGTVDRVIKTYGQHAKGAEKYHDKLKHLTDPKTYGSLTYVTAALARQGSLYDSLRTGLFNTREPALILFKPQEEKILRQLEESGNEDLMDTAILRREQRVNLWRNKRDQELGSADAIAVNRYTQAVAIARKFNVRSGAVNRALQRLAFFTDTVGDAKMAQYTQGVEGFTYKKGMFQKTRPGMVVEPKAKPMTPPLPVVVK